MIYMLSYRDEAPPGIPVVDVTSRSTNWSRAFSPFILGPCEVAPGVWAENVENAWQYSKIYPGYLGKDGKPTLEWFKWARDGFSKFKANRYPMGRGKKPLCSYWHKQTLDYIEARKQIYIPLYKQAVEQYASGAFKKLKKLYQAGDVGIRDFDAYRYDLEGMTLKQVIDRTDKKMGHGFILAMMLEE